MKKNTFLTIKTVLLPILILGAGIVIYKKATKKTSPQKPQDTLVVGMMSGWVPYMSINQQGQYEGFDVDVAQAIAQKMGKKLIIKDFGTLAPLFVALEQGRIDIIMSGLDITKDRINKLSMVQYGAGGFTTFCLLFWNKIPEGINSVQDFSKYPNAQICVEPGSSTEKYLDGVGFKNQKPIGSVPEMIMEIKYGKSLAVLLEPPVVSRLMKKNPEIKKLEIEIPEKFQVFGTGIAIKKENRSLTTQVTKIIQELKQNKTLQKLEQKWDIEV